MGRREERERKECGKERRKKRGEKERERRVADCYPVVNQLQLQCQVLAPGGSGKRGTALHRGSAVLHLRHVPAQINYYSTLALFLPFIIALLPSSPFPLSLSLFIHLLLLLFLFLVPRFFVFLKENKIN